MTDCGYATAGFVIYWVIKSTMGTMGAGVHVREGWVVHTEDLL